MQEAGQRAPLTRTANCLASAIRSNDLELTPEEQRALTAAYGVLERGCAIYGKTAAIAKQNASNRAKRLDQAKALVKARFAGLESTTDRVAFIAATLSYSLRPDSPAGPDGSGGKSLLGQIDPQRKIR